MRAICITMGIALMAAALFLHVSCCSWTPSDCGAVIVGEIRPSKYFGENTMLAGVLGLVAPALMAVGGFGLILASDSLATPKTERPRTPPPPVATEGTVNEPPNPNLLPCPDCGRNVSRLATSCPQCGRPLKPQSGDSQ